jgi:uncharacterized membrane protein YbaN (DUF454 family)
MLTLSPEDNTKFFILAFVCTHSSSNWFIHPLLYPGTAKMFGSYVQNIHLKTKKKFSLLSSVD